MMLTAKTTHNLLQSLRLDLQKHLPDEVETSETTLFLETQYHNLCTLLSRAEDDFSVVLSLIEQDPDCKDNNPHRRLNALIDYLDIAVAIYDTIPAKPHLRVIN